MLLFPDLVLIVMQASQVQNRELLLVIVAKNDTVCRKQAQIKAHQDSTSSKPYSKALHTPFQ